MSVGIRGTSGYVYYDEDGRESVIITDGVVKVSAYNPETGETKTIEVHGGKKVTCYLYSDKTEEHDTIEFDLEEISEDQLPYFPLKMLIENEHLLDKVCEYTGWDKDKLRALFESFYETVKPTPTPEDTEAVTETPTPTDKATPTPTLTPIPTVTLVPSISTTPKVTPSSTPAAGSTTVPTTTPGSSDVTITTTTPKPTSTTAPKGTSYTVSFVTNGKCTAPSAQTVSSGSKATKPADPVAEGYSFGGWYKDSACTNSYNFNMIVTSNITLYAKWTATSSTPTITPKPTKAPMEPPSELPGDQFVWLIDDEENDIYIAYYYWGYGTTYMVYADNETGWVQAEIVYDSYGDYDLAWFESPETGVYYSFEAPYSAPEGYYMSSYNALKYIAYKYDDSGNTVYQLYVAGKGWVEGFCETTTINNVYYDCYYYYDDSGNRVDYYIY
ncbi:MAG: InlB B-repeat-containing protein [Saccharofermentans sp.]|nr:InlB B-repeat-containing protein [Saccharofermentans sp.]